MNKTKQIEKQQLNQELNIKYIPVNKLKPHPDNPRVHSPKQVKQISDSINTFGFRFPVLIDANNQIIAGHGRVMASQKLKLDTIPTIQVDNLSEHQVRALMIADNKLTENSTWDDTLLAQNIEILMEVDLDFDIEVMGFDYGELEEITMSIENSEPIDDPVDIPVSTHTASTLGDIWVCGKHRLICADSLNEQTYQMLLEDKKVDIIFTDPPYNLSASVIGSIAKKEHGDFIQAAGEMTTEEFTVFLTTLFERLVSVSKQGSIHYVCMDWRHIQEIMSAGLSTYSELKNLCVWAKDRAGMGSFYRSQHELVFVFKHGNTKHKNNFSLGEHGRYRTNVWQYPCIRTAEKSDTTLQTSALALHPTMKPISMVRDALLDCSQRGDIVLDPFMGSGTTLLAAEQCHRVAMGVELEPKYMDVAIRRWQIMTGQPAVHAKTGLSFDETVRKLKK